MAHNYATTYTNDPEDNVIDFVRLTLGDTDCVTPNFALLTDAEIQFRIDGEASRERAAWRSCQDIVSKLTRVSSDFGAGSQRESKSQTLEHYRRLEDDLSTRGAGEFAAILAGGLSTSEKQDRREDTDRIPAQFRRDRFRNHRIGRIDSDTFVLTR